MLWIFLLLICRKGFPNVEATHGCVIRLRPIFNQRFYVHFVIYHKTREIIQFAITTNPVREFVKQQIIDFSENLSEVVYLIHDRANEFRLNYLDYGIQGVKTSVKSPNMPLGARRVNSIAERWIASVRKEMLDHFIIFNQKQLYNILKEYIENYYNCKRPHQAESARQGRIEQRIPRGYIIRKNGRIKSRQILFGLNQDFYREAA